jgi:hypothetical protein
VLSSRTFFTVAAALCALATRATADDITDDAPTSAVPYLGGGIALTGAAGATLFFLDAKRARRDADAHYRTDPAFATDRRRFVVERDTAVAFASLTAIGLGLLVYHWLGSAPQREPRVGVGIAPDGALVTFGGTL